MWEAKKYTLCSEELGEEFESDSLVDIYLEQKRLKEDDKEHHDKKTYYVFKNTKIDATTVSRTEGKVYKRGNKVFFKAI
jgi:hypothetical protein